ncbi:MAG: hypothetical protein QNJ48_09515, partial [Desulfobacterales bacterium]|nr:hypothetical protein [Desulfobacterales bacterium]
MLTLTRHAIAALLIMAVLLLPAIARASDAASPPEASPAIGLSEEMGDAMLRQATEVGEDITRQAKTLFEREPLGWDLNTLAVIYHWALDFPAQIATLVATVIDHSRVLGAAGSMVMLIFIVAVLYSLIG